MRALPVVLLAACAPLVSSPPPQPQAPVFPSQGLPSGPPGMEMMSEAATTTPPPDDQPLQDDPAPPPPEAERKRPPPPPPQKPASSLPADAQAMLDFHNDARAKHCAPALTWSPKLAQVAQSWANNLRDHDCAFEHSRGQYGENLAAGTTGYMEPKDVVGMWYDEIKDYSFKNPGFSSGTGHFTQVVWKGSTSLGCGKSVCKGMDVWVCEYDPPGNWEGAYKENVLPTTCAK